MLVSLEWLNEYCDLKDLSPEEVARSLTDIGLEVEGIKTNAPLDSGILIGSIKTAKPHPEADNLQLCTVQVGKDRLLPIVCGAPNARAGLKVAVATIGSVLPGDFKIKKAKIRGEVSEGMLCSEKELGLSEAHAGILELSESYREGEPLANFIKTAGTVIELSITPNRGDCLSYIGIARDLAAKLRRTFKYPEIAELPISAMSSKENVTVKVAPEVGCGRFTALYCQGVKTVPSPAWMQRRLEASGMRPINLLVDITNYCMLEMGQPIHAYDERTVAKNVLEVRSANLGDKLVTLDGTQVDLKPGDMLICDAEKPVGLAGIMGGENSEVKEDTSAIIIEVAHFAADLVRKTAKRLSVHTEASHRFERGIDIQNLDKVLLRVATLLRACAQECGLTKLTVSRDFVDFYPLPVPLTRIAVRLPRARSILALPTLSLDNCVKHLEALEFQLIDKTDERMLFEVPSFRNDIIREIDLIEEIGRMEGYDKVPYELPRMEIRPNYEDPYIEFADKVKITLANLGLCEVITYPFLSNEDFARLQIEQKHPLWPSIYLANALNEEMSAMQTSLVPSLLKALNRNRHHGQKGARIFEMGRAYSKGEAKSSLDDFYYYKDWWQGGRHLTPRAREEKYRAVEKQLLAGALDHPFYNQDWNQEAQAPSFFHGKQIIQTLAAGFGVSKLEWVRPPKAEFPWLHPGACAVVEKAGHKLGWLGELHPKVALELGLEDDIPVLFELDMEALYHESTNVPQVEAAGRRFPPVLRDFAFLLDKERSFLEFQKAVDGFSKRKFLKTMKLFDLYEGDNIPAGKKSLAASFTFEATDKTLTDKEVEKEAAELRAWLEKAVGAQLR